MVDEAFNKTGSDKDQDMVKLHQSVRGGIFVNLARRIHCSIWFPVSIILTTVMRASNCFSIPSTLPALALLNTRLKTQSVGTTKVNGNLSPSTLPVDCVDYRVLSAMLQFCMSQTDRRGGQKCGQTD